VTDLAARLADARTKADISQEVLSRAAGLSSRLVGMIERGTRPNPGLNTITSLAEVLGVKVAWLISGEGAEPKVKALRLAGEAAQAKVDAAKRAAKGRAA
jgi:transcriptional regulator with XRE-family HTH domain